MKRPAELDDQDRQPHKGWHDAHTGQPVSVGFAIALEAALIEMEQDVERARQRRAASEKAFWRMTWLLSLLVLVTVAWLAL